MTVNVDSPATQPHFEKRDFSRIHCDGEVTFHFSGLGQFTGQVFDLSPTAGYFRFEAPAKLEKNLEGSATVRVGEKMFVSYGSIIRKDASGIAFQLRDGMRIFKYVSKLIQQAESSPISRILMGQQVNQILETTITNEQVHHKINCWEFKKCGKEGECIAGTSTEYNGRFGGKNGGRYCAYIEGTICLDAPGAKGLDKMAVCLKCDFYQILMEEIFSASR
ncbi:MAG: hypothetical protein HQL52_11925 [Magnetococcales bacterium]|nr:hypothetical protein [Magnetococcales bacterium]